MSGGFFRGTSADQDTRFSNKMSKLLKTQKFAPELDVIIDTSKVKMDVIRPWIATRVTELLGFEDEVLINFIYGLLDVKEADGKHLQIQLTGFMEKNTGRFMKELWGLLTSAQNNVSGIPQQFLDAKAEEAKKKKDEKDRILSEVQRKKEEQEKDAEERKEQERLRQLSAPQEPTKRTTSASPVRRGNGEGGRKGRSLRRSSLSPRGSGSSSSSHSRSPVRRRRSRSLSRSPRRRRRSGSPYRRRSPLRPRSPFRRRRSPVFSRSPPRRRKSPPLRSPPRYRSRTPPRIRRRSPLDGPSPPRRHGGGPRSPPLRRRSPSASLSPPVARRSTSRSPFPKGRSPSKDRSGRRSRSPFQRRKSPNRHRGSRPSRSPPYQRRRSPSRDRELGGQVDRSPHRRRRSPSREYGGGRRNGFDARDRERPARDGERLERRNDRGAKRENNEQRLPYSREQERVLSRNGRDSRPSDTLITGEKRTHKDLEEEVELGTTKREESDLQDAEADRPGNKIALRVRGQADSSGTGTEDTKRAREKKESVAEPAAISLDEDHEPESRQQKCAGGIKEVADVPDDEVGSESPGSSEERHEAKRRRKEEKRLRKEEKRRRREEKHRRKEEKRAAKTSKAGLDHYAAGSNGRLKDLVPDSSRDTYFQTTLLSGFRFKFSFHLFPSQGCNDECCPLAIC
ncbi:hypothetical protein R1flu_027851 [Riccia fluitans]|uniref:PWI domain-containing protein n=1 Tax=Riccia fluitans TaxID=41844 RepID=A0ABD1XJZ6_9MARC